MPIILFLMKFQKSSNFERPPISLCCQWQLRKGDLVNAMGIAVKFKTWMENFFSRISVSENFKITKNHLTAILNVIYLIENRFLPEALKQPWGSTLIVVIVFIKSTKGFNQQKIHLHICQESNSGIHDWTIASFYQVKGNLHYLKQEASMRQYKLDYAT